MTPWLVVVLALALVWLGWESWPLWTWLRRRLAARRDEPDPLELPGFLPGERDEWRRRG